MMTVFNCLSLRQRRRKIGQFLELFRPDSDTLVLDVGISDREYRESDNLIEKEYPYPNRIVALGIGELKNFKERYSLVKVVAYDGGRFPFKNAAFDIVYLNAVIEHVGNYDKQRQFIHECFRVGENVFITTPNRFFPIELHTKLPLLHYLPKRYFDRILCYLGMAWATGDYMHLLSYKQFQSLFENCGPIIYLKNRFLGFTVTFTATRSQSRM